MVFAARGEPHAQVKGKRLTLENAASALVLSSEPPVSAIADVPRYSRASRLGPSALGTVNAHRLEPQARPRPQQRIKRPNQHTLAWMGAMRVRRLGWVSGRAPSSPCAGG